MVPAPLASRIFDANGELLLLDVRGLGGVALQLSGTFTLTVQFEAQPRALFATPQRQGRRMSRRKSRLPQCLICAVLQRIQVLRLCAASLPCAALQEKPKTQTCGGSGCNTRNTSIMPRCNGVGRIDNDNRKTGIYNSRRASS